MIRHTPPGPPLAATGLTASGVVSPGSFGELEVAAFDTKNVIVYGTQNGPFRSTNGGQTVTASTFNTAPAPPNTVFASNGDPTVAVGAPDAAFNQVVISPGFRPPLRLPSATGRAWRSGFTRARTGDV